MISPVHPSLPDVIASPQGVAISPLHPSLLDVIASPQGVAISLCPLDP